MPAAKCRRVRDTPTRSTIGDPLPDPASRFQPDGVHGWSEVDRSRRSPGPTAHGAASIAHRLVDLRAARRHLHASGHVCAASTERLPYLRDLGVTAIELMPLADFPGAATGDTTARRSSRRRARTAVPTICARSSIARTRSASPSSSTSSTTIWVPKAPTCRPSAREFLTTAHQTPWGVRRQSRPRRVGRHVRRLLIENALHWIHEYHADGLRLDATHALFDDGPTPFVPELTRAVHAAARSASDGVRGGSSQPCDDGRRRSRTRGGDSTASGPTTSTTSSGACWPATRTGTTSITRGRPRSSPTILRRGWLYAGQTVEASTASRAGPIRRGVPMRASVICVQNHDQIGNRAFGDRLHHSADPAAWRAAVTVLLTSPDDAAAVHGTGMGGEHAVSSSSPISSRTWVRR